MRILKIALSFLLCLLLGGCYDAVEPNEIAYVVAMGIDRTEHAGIYEFTIQFANTTQISGGSGEEGGKAGSEITDLISVRAPTIYSGINLANHSISKRFTLAHTKLFVLSEELAREGVRELGDAIGRNSDIRPNIYLAVSRGKAGDYLKAVKPVAEVNPVNYYRLIFESQYSGFVPKNMIQDFYARIQTNERSCVLPIVGVSEQEGQENKRDIKLNESGFEYRIYEYIAGDSDIAKKNPSEVMGMALFSGDRMVGEMSEIEGELYNILTGQYRSSYATFHAPDGGEKPITVQMSEPQKPKKEACLTSNGLEISIRIFLEGELVSESAENPIDGKVEEFERQAEEALRTAAEKFLKKAGEEYRADPIGIGEAARRCFRTYPEYEAYGQKNRFSDAAVEVSVEFELQRVGFIAVEG